MLSRSTVVYVYTRWWWREDEVCIEDGVVPLLVSVHLGIHARKLVERNVIGIARLTTEHR